MCIVCCECSHGEVLSRELADASFADGATVLMDTAKYAVLFAALNLHSHNRLDYYLHNTALARSSIATDLADQVSYFLSHHHLLLQ